MRARRRQHVTLWSRVAGPDSPRKEIEWPLVIGGAFVLGASVRAAFALAFPTIHGGDAAARLASAGTLVLGYQLPLPQLLVTLAKWLSDDPIFARLLFCLCGGGAAAGLSALLAVTFGTRAALFGGLLASFDPLLIHYSIVPYQEPVAYGLILWSLCALAAGRDRVAGLLLGAACLSRYEAWLFLPWFLFATRSWSARCLAAAPSVAWIVWWRGLAPQGLYVLDLETNSDRLTRVAFLLRKFQEYEGFSLLCCAAAGLVLAWREEDRRVPRAIIGLALVIAVVVGAGHEYPAGSGLMSERLIHLPVLAALFLAAVALDRAASRWPSAFAGALIVASLLVARNVHFETGLLKAAARDPDLSLARDTAREIGRLRSEGECVTVIAPTVDPTLLTAYVAKVEASFGDVGRARERASALAATAPDRDRIAAHLEAPAGTVHATGDCPLIVEIDVGERTRNVPGTIVSRVTAGSRQAAIYRILR